MIHTSHIRIDLDAIAGNLRSIQAEVGTETSVCPVIKADAYGLGADRVARTLVEAGAQRLAVFTLQQAIELESSASHARILVLMPVQEIPNDPAIARLIAAGRLELVITDRIQAARLASTRLGRALPVHLEVDCGMGRGGIAASEAPALLDDLQDHRSLHLVGLFTHFSSSDPEQVDHEAAIFDQLLSGVEHQLGRRVIKHAASSGPCFTVPTQQRDMVRIGLGWAGWLPVLDPSSSRGPIPRLRPAVTWCSQLVQTRTLEAGSTVGYGSQWHAPKTTQVGLVPVGYAHGYPARLHTASEQHQVLISVGDGWRAAPIVGAVSMDQLVVDLGGLDGFEPARDHEVILLSDQLDSRAGLHAIANRSGIPPHAVLSGLGAAIPRVYLTEGSATSRGQASLLSVSTPISNSSMAAG
ncbi:MAG: alanine racemase [Planctomycetes bacterium TMED75]|nr:alanine racemase [Planctomycetaceae bacterium]OUU94594.1 MAG: alanine racemase [Planctomycetes bacterium TMED75]